MQSTRLEAFSDGVIAIIITIMVLELHVPHDETTGSLIALSPVFLSYVLSFVTVAIYWVNHHHLIHLVRRVTSRLLWANIHFLFWLSLLPFATAYLGAHPRLPMASALYGSVATGCALGFLLIQHGVAIHLARTHVDTHQANTSSAKFRARNIVAVATLVASIPLAWLSTWISIALFCLPALAYFMPDDARVEGLIDAEGQAE